MHRVIRLFGLALAVLLAAPARGTVSTSTSTVSYTCNSSTTAFAVSFPFFASGDLVVTNTPVGVAPITLHAGVDFTVTGGAGSTGTLTTVGGYSPCANGNTLTISRNILLTQPTPFSTQGSFSPKAHEKAFDRLTMEVQQVDRRVAGAEGTHASDKAAQATRDSQQDWTWTNNIAALNGTSHAQSDLSSVLSLGSTTPRTLTARFADVVNVLDFTGATADIQLANAIAALPSSGGTVDAQAYKGTTQTIAATVTISSAAKRVTVLFDPCAEDVGKWLAWRGVMASPLGSAPFIGPGMKALEGGSPGRDVSLTPWTQLLNAGVRAGQVTAAAVSAEGELTDEQVTNLFLAWLEAGGQATGAPSVQVGATTRYWTRKTGSEGPAEDVFGTMYGPKRPGKLSEALFGGQ